MTKQAKEKDINTLSFSEGLSLFTIQVVAMFYFVLLYTITWGWFLADRFFELGYWELFLGAAIVRYILLPTSTGILTTRFEEKFGKLSFGTRLTNVINTVAINTVFFGILYIVHLMISYYS